MNLRERKHHQRTKRRTSRRSSRRVSVFHHALQNHSRRIAPLPTARVTRGAGACVMANGSDSRCKPPVRDAALRQRLVRLAHADGPPPSAAALPVAPASPSAVVVGGLGLTSHVPGSAREHRDPPPVRLDGRIEHRGPQTARGGVRHAEHELVRRADIILALRAVPARPHENGRPTGRVLEAGAPGARRYTVYSTKSVSPFCAVFPVALARVQLAILYPRRQRHEHAGVRLRRALVPTTLRLIARPPDLLLRPAVGAAGRGGRLAPARTRALLVGTADPRLSLPTWMACRRPREPRGRGTRAMRARDRRARSAAHRADRRGRRRDARRADTGAGVVAIVARTTSGRRCVRRNLL